MYQFELEKLGIDLLGRNHGKLKTKCPVCDQRKGGTRDKDLSVNINEGLYNCHSSNCSFSGKIRLKEYSRPTFDPNTTSLPTGMVRKLEARGISQGTLKKMQISVSEKGGMVFNYFRNGSVVNQKTRWTTPDGGKAFKQHTGAEKILYNLDSLQGKTKCIFVEGEMDVLSWVEAGVSNDYAIVSVDIGAPNPGSNPDGKLECLKNCAADLDGVEEFFLCTDKDAPGQYLQSLLIERLGAYRCSIIELPEGCKDANDVLQQDHQDISVLRETLRLNLKNAQPVPVPGIHLLDDARREIMRDYFKNGRPKGETTHFPEIDKRFSFLPGDLTVVTGIPSHGKGQVIRQFALMRSKFDNWRWACYVPEDMAADIFFDDIVHSYVGSSPYAEHQDQMSEAEYESAMDFVKDHFFLIYPEADKKTGEIDLPTNKWLNEKIRFLKLKYGVNAYIKDPWNKIFHSFSEREDQYLAKEISKEKFFAAQFDAALYVAHPKTMRKTQDGGYEKPTMYDISGGSMWYNMADNGLVVHRPNIHTDPNDKVTEFHSLKIKKQKLVGRPGKVDLFFEIKENRYYTMGAKDYNPLSAGKKPVTEPETFELTPSELLPF